MRTEKRTETDKTGKSKEVVYYIYRGVVPKAAFLKTFNNKLDPWLKLWRDALWATLRGKPTTRGPYEQRASKKHVGEASQMWKELLGLSKVRSKGQLYATEVASSLFIGAQAKNAERVPFKGPPDLNLLLHFWPVVMSVYVPETIDREGKRVSTGYVLAVPDVADVEEFSQLYPEFIAQLKPDVAGFRPRDAIISLPQEGGLEYVHHLLSLAKAKETKKEPADYLTAVEVYHLEKLGNNIQMRTADRVPVKEEVLKEYEAIRRSYRNPILKAQLIRNLLHGARIGERIPWYFGFDRVFATHNWELFVGEKARGFSYEARERFKSEFQTLRGDSS